MILLESPILMIVAEHHYSTIKRENIYLCKKALQQSMLKNMDGCNSNSVL